MPAQRFTNEADLRFAVRNYAAGKWLKLTKRAWGYEDRACFLDRDLPEHELLALTVGRQLRVTLEELARFAATYQRRPETQVVVNVVDGDELPAAATIETRKLLRIVEENLRELDPRVRDDADRAIDIAHDASPRSPGWLKVLGNVPGERKVARRERIVALLRDHTGYWQRFGLNEPASNRTMALASILTGNFPEAQATAYRAKLTAGSKRKKARAGRTVADVMKAETAAIRLARSKLRRDRAIQGEYPALVEQLKGEKRARKTPARPQK